MKKAAVVFDMDGILFDTERIYIELWEGYAMRHGFPGGSEIMYRCIGTNSRETKKIMQDAYGHLGFDYDSYIREVSAEFQEKYGDGRCPMKKGVNNLLSYLKENGAKVALATSTARANAERMLKGAGIYQYFDELICGDMVSHSKPDPEIFLVACDKIGEKPEDVFIIEDSFNGIRAAYSAGAKALMVPDILQPDEEIRGKSFKVMKDLDEVRDFFSQLEES